MSPHNPLPRPGGPTRAADWSADTHPLPEPLAALAERLAPAPCGAGLRRVFTDLARLAAGAARVDEMLLEDCAPDEALASLAVIDAEAHDLLDFVAEQAAVAEGQDDALYDALDGVTYALRHELRRVFRDELVGLGTLKNPSSVRVQLAHASDLLGNCFQQSTITLAQVFDPALDGCRIFDNYRDRLEQSLALCKELWVLVQRIRRATRERDCASIVAFVEGLKRFRHAKMHYLMYRDWHGFESYVRRVLGTRSTGELMPVLEQFETYLETLLGHVRRRAVLLDRTHDESEAEVQ